jgi:PTS system nitrogen regulatory IIA component
MGHGIAIPHCRLLGIDSPVVVWGRLREGVVFGGIDDEPCDLIILILSSVGDPKAHMKLLAATARILGCAETRQALRVAEDTHAFVEVVRTAP